MRHLWCGSPRLFTGFTGGVSCSNGASLLQSAVASTSRAVGLPHNSISKQNGLRAIHTTSSRLKDPYKVLNVAPDASAGDIKTSYYQVSQSNLKHANKLAKKYHPDQNKDSGSKEKFVEVQAAYDLLSDPDKRKNYDQFGEASTSQGFDANNMYGNPFSQGRAGAAGGSGGPFAGFGGGAPGFGGRGAAEDIFDTLFGAFANGGGAQPSSRAQRTDREGMRGEDIEQNVTISFLQACLGTTKTVNTKPIVTCKTCSGNGLKPGAKKSTCAACGGSGRRTFVVQAGFHMNSTCMSCGGTGETAPKNSSCHVCDGVGRVRDRQAVSVGIPAGIENGMKVRMPKAGSMPVGANGPPGDLLVNVTVEKSEHFKRSGMNLIHEAKIPFYKAMLGGTIRIPTLEKDVEVRLVSGTQQGETMVLRGKGVPNVHRASEKGDLVISFNIILPRTLKDDQRRLIEEYAEVVEKPDALKRSTSTAHDFDDIYDAQSTKQRRGAEI